MGRHAYETFVCSCGERCTMLPNSRTGKLAPITEASYPNGNIEVGLGSSGVMYRIVPKRERARDPNPRRLNHFSNCPDRQHFGGQ